MKSAVLRLYKTACVRQSNVARHAHLKFRVLFRKMLRENTLEKSVVLIGARKSDMFEEL